MGRPASFIRLSNCNLTCTWCDTPYTWDWRGRNGQAYDRAAESTEIDPAELLLWAERTLAPLMVVTGGEPLFWRDIGDLLLPLAQLKEVEVETNGTLAPPPAVAAHSGVRFNVSPKLANSGVAFTARRRPDALQALADTSRAIWKFVVTSVDDLDEIEEICTIVQARPADVWLMPEGATVEAQLANMPWVTDVAISRGWNVSPRLHVLIWGNERGH